MTKQKKSTLANTILGGGFKYFWNFHPELWGRFSPILTCAYFSDGRENNHQLVLKRSNLFMNRGVWGSRKFSPRLFGNVEDQTLTPNTTAMFSCRCRATEVQEVPSKVNVNREGMYPDYAYSPEI